MAKFLWGLFFTGKYSTGTPLYPNRPFWHLQNLLKLFEDKAPNLCSGGSAANTVIGFAGFGGKAAHKTVLGKDKFGESRGDSFYCGKRERRIFGGGFSASKIHRYP